MKYYLAVDIGASSGRLILAHMEEGKIITEEIHRFPNGMVKEADGHDHWDIDRLFHEILTGMKKCHAQGKDPSYMGIDTWAVDFVLLGKDGKKLMDPLAYRDHGTEGMDAVVYEKISEEELYRRTGIQKAIFNTIYQLMELKTKLPEALAEADDLLMVPDYLNYCLTGIRKQEYTNASTTKLVNAKTRTWDRELIDLLGFPQKLFHDLSEPGTIVGELRDDVQKEVGFNCQVVLPCTHDTGSAVLAVPQADEHTLYISSGTWSLLGCERKEPDTSMQAHDANFTNEGGYGHTIRFLKNIMGLWMIQCLQKEFQKEDPQGDYSFGTLCQRAAEESISSIVDVNEERFLSPDSMTQEVQEACRESRQEVPVTPWQMARVVYRSLAVRYQWAVRELEDMTGQTFNTLCIVGGGSKAVYLDELTAASTGLHVLAGPSEATALGNLGVQMMADDVFPDVSSFRACIRKSFSVKEY
jgi:rhamnulokinase